MPDQEEVTEQAKKAYVLSRQIIGLESAMEDKGGVNGYPAYVKNFNSFLNYAQEILAMDEIFLEAIQHLEPYETEKKSGYVVEFEGIKNDLPVLREAVLSFCAFYLPQTEKERIGFRQGQ